MKTLINVSLVALGLLLGCASHVKRIDCEAHLRPINAPAPAARPSPAAQPSPAALPSPAARP